MDDRRKRPTIRTVWGFNPKTKVLPSKKKYNRKKEKDNAIKKREE